ncbi:phosphatidylglycerol/phosphatidylinositol transfer protein [Anaeramoeba ignava]|uniref:Phosphatidylglycerol/phosphatidylinositol transfer protein n=1 Tax=Anaeramoeba ignava TaxID=1746090 RepID=A0A9Q0RGD1_ANAIG|nr:phosphatidylglycerol/phosphatidylinositol transfer protein [Anaeramoeba ignava]
MKTIFFFLIIIIFPLIQTKEWSYCETTKYPLELSELQVVPDPPIVGKPIEITLDGNLTTEIDEGSAYVTVYFNSIKILQIQENLCSLPGFSCPIKVGKLTINLDEPLPAYVPAGEYSGQIELVGDNSLEILCINYDIHIDPN